MRSGVIIAIILLAAAATASDKSADWLTDGGNPQRTAWQKDETILNTNNVAGMKLLWKVKLDNEQRQMHSLLPSLIIGRVTTTAGPKQMVIETGVSDNLYGIDAATGALIWHKHFRAARAGEQSAGQGFYVCREE